MSDLKEVKFQLKKFIADTSFIDASKINDDSFIFREGLFDSMGLMSLITFIEENFQIQIKDTELIEENFESVNAIYNFLRTKIKEPI
jgi:acyl carrier protein